MNNNRCIVCGVIIPEGLQVCPNCEKATAKQIKEMSNDLSKAMDEAHDMCSNTPCIMCDNYAIDLAECKCVAITQILHKQGYRKQSEVAKEIIDFSNEMIKTIDNENGVSNTSKILFKASIKLLQTKIMERYGV